MLEYLLADDLSGALDAAGAFHAAGRRVRIVFTADRWRAEPEDDVVAVTTETRNAPPEAAAEVVARAIAHGRAQGATLVYKKIDSTLRGPVAAEVGALAQAWPAARILFCPANPRVGRAVRGGVLLVEGVPVAETEFARDPVSPVRESRIAALLGAEAGSRVTLVDAATEADLAAAVVRMDAAGGDWVGVGSGALARPIAARRPAAVKPARAARSSAAGGPALMLCGSAHPANREQAACLARARGVEVRPLPIAAADEAAAEAVRTMRGGRGAALLIEAQRGDSREVLRVVARTGARVLAEAQVRCAFVTGGETAFALAAELGVASLTFAAEIEPGLSVSDAVSPRGAFRFAIKPGGFGGAQTWVRAWDALVDD